MRQIIIDFETRSECDLPKRGLMNYTKDPSTDILMLGWKVVGDLKAHIWLPNEQLPTFLTDNIPTHFYAFNAEFELMIWNEVGVKKHDFPVMKLSYISCIAALANRYGFPNTLEAVGAALGCKAQKNPEGKALIQIFCTPKHGWPPHIDGRWQRFIQYCKDDCLAEEEILLSLPAQDLSTEERQVWENTVEMNMRGIPIDYSAAKQIRRVSEAFREAHYELLPELTNGAITKITQTKRIKDFCELRGYPIENCTANVVSEALLQDLPDDVMQLLEMRSQIGLSSIGKYIRFEEMSYNGKIYFNQRYYGAHTGRWTGAGVQIFNLPRKQIEDPDAEIERFFDGSIVDNNPIKSARALIRSMIKAEDGKMLVWADWSSIEYVLIEWFAGNQKALDRFALKYDQYKDQAVATYYRPLNQEEHDEAYQKITKEQRQFGKVLVLGCGFGQGANKLQITAKRDWGLEISEEQSQHLVSSYRKEHFLVVNMWYAYHKAVVEAVTNPGQAITCNKCVFKVVRDHMKHDWLTIQLPSGRKLFYFRPFLEMSNRGPVVCYYGFSQKIKQWLLQDMIPGRIAENIVQATSRCILVEALKELRARNVDVLWSTYDEIVCQVPEENAEQFLITLDHIMCTCPSWAKNLPLRTEGFVQKRYRKM